MWWDHSFVDCATSQIQSDKTLGMIALGDASVYHL